MMTLSETWFMEGYIDYELQRYRLLAYLQDVRKQFHEKKLYPLLSDIVAHYNNLLLFRANKHNLQESFPKRINGIDASRMQLIYERILTDDALMQELEEITEFAVTEMKGTISEGAGIYDAIERDMHMEPVGIVPLYKNEGYLFLRTLSHADVWIYAYTVTIFEQQDARYRGVRIAYIDNRKKTIINTYEQLKLEIVRKIRTLPNPAVYCIEFPEELPLQETMLPIAKRSLMRIVS